MAEGTKIDLILASSSSRRIDLLSQIGITPSLIVPPNIDETVQSNEKPREYVQRMSMAKASASKSSGKFYWPLTQ